LDRLAKSHVGHKQAAIIAKDKRRAANTIAFEVESVVETHPAEHQIFTAEAHGRSNILLSLV